tara:strand:- start:217 stop:1200 length:984 start_codon:yes stop_codon:yes gene_type:complete
VSNFLKSLLTFAVSMVFCLAIVEAGVRLLADDGMQYDLEMWKYARTMKRVSAIADAGHDHVPGTSARLMGVEVRINSTGQRNTEILRPKPDGVYRIVMLGDSLTFGWGVEEEQTSSRRLERMLNSARSSAKRVSIVNAGVGNYNTKMQAAWLVAEGDIYEPDMIILNYFINDAEPTPVRRGGALRERSAAFVYFWSRADALQRKFFGKADWHQYYRDLYRPDARGWHDTQSAFGRLVEYARTRDIPLLVVNYPELRALSPYPFRDISNQIEALAGRYRLPYLDLLPTVTDQTPETLWVSLEDAHPNAKAFALFSEAIADWVAGHIHH